MKKQIVSGIFLLAFFLITVKAQEVKEVVQALSSKATNGHMFNASKDEKGNTNVVYQMKLDKKSDVLSFENYSFDSGLKFIGVTPAKEDKVKMENRQSSYFSAYVGGTTSFDVLSQKLKIYKIVKDEYWNYSRQAYKTKKVVSRETFRPKNDLGKMYNAYADFWNYGKDGVSNGLIIAKVDSKGNGLKQYLLLLFGSNLELKEVPLDLNGACTLVYAVRVDDGSIAMIFAPDKGAADVSKYVYYLYDIDGNMKNKVEFKSPASALLITAACEKNGDVFFFGTSKKSTEAYSKVFKEYAPIYNPGSITSKMEGANILDVYWRDCQKQKMDNFHILKFNGNNLVLATTTPVSDFKAKFRSAQGDKGASAYQGKKFNVENFFVAPSGDYLITGQLTKTAFFGLENMFDAYQDVVCFQFDKNGVFKAQYGVGRLNEDKASEMFPMIQNFYPALDGKSVYLALKEVKGNKDWYTGIPSPVYYPHIVKIDLAGTSISSMKPLGEGKYYLSDDFPGIFDKDENSITYVGSDLKEKNLWLGKVIFK